MTKIKMQINLSFQHNGLNVFSFFPFFFLHFCFSLNSKYNLNLITKQKGTKRDSIVYSIFFNIICHVKLLGTAPSCCSTPPPAFDDISESSSSNYRHHDERRLPIGGSSVRSASYREDTIR